MKPILAGLLVVELLVAYCLGGSFLWVVRPHQERVAFAVWLQKRTPEARAEFERQQRLDMWCALGFSAIAFGAMAVPTLLVARTRRRQHGDAPVVPCS